MFSIYGPDIIVNSAVQAGVRHSITLPDIYMESNIKEFYNILEVCRYSYDNGAKEVEHLIYASFSSVYGGNNKILYSIDGEVDHPVSLYAATQKSNKVGLYAAGRYDSDLCGCEQIGAGF